MNTLEPKSGERIRDVHFTDDTISENNKDKLFDRVVSILEQARSNVVRSVNSNMVIAYWLIGCEIVEEIQEGEGRAEYGKQVLKELSEKLNKCYGSGFSIPNLQNFRKFYQKFSDRFSIQYPVDTELLKTENNVLENSSVFIKEKQYPMGTISLSGFSPQLSWSHYRALMRVKKDKARLFYEKEAIECCWDKRTLERHIQSQYYERLLKSQQPEAMQKSARLEIQKHNPSAEILKNPYILEFLGLPDSSTLHESELESAIITNLQTFLLELET
jgi:hypothetical protein